MLCVAVDAVGDVNLQAKGHSVDQLWNRTEVCVEMDTEGEDEAFGYESERIEVGQKDGKGRWLEVGGSASLMLWSLRASADSTSSPAPPRHAIAN
jgi:hypothetical protein